MRVDFTKMHGLGNDFIIFDSPAAGFAPSRELWRRLAARHTGIGFDQALMLEKPREPGLRRLLSHLQCRRRRGRAVRQRRALHRCAIEPPRSDAGRRNDPRKRGGTCACAHGYGEKLVAIDLGVPDFAPARIAV
jgi:diaminopimelate epimerase